MKDILAYLIILLILGILRAALPKVKVVKHLLIARTVEAMERKIQGSRRGSEKKAKAIRVLRWFGVRADETTSAMIDLAVEAMNARNSAVSSSLKEAVSDQVKSGAQSAGAAIKNKLSKDSGEGKS
ncbi:hypothetical protein SDC9_65950 [bioreactor metagenome]|uniref:Uncharacterized protein n=1 Tax=bioreactor metagenome TaxID=1076179 RepID=A0A644XZU7_9ZZZZ